MVYDDPVDATYVVPEYNKDAKEDDADDEKETEITRSEQDPVWMRSVWETARASATMSRHTTSTLEDVQLPWNQ